MKRKTGKLMIKCLPGLLLVFTFFEVVSNNGGVTIIDSQHYSEVFGEMRNYRIFLPPGYFQHTDRYYPVIYFYHGWSQRYFGSINTPDIDQGGNNNGDNIANYVARHDVIVVKPDGYNRNPGDPYYLRPYNIGPVETYRQFPLYFPEIVKYIDANYRTIPDRDHRAISGLSMGGFMTFWIAGKYPEMVCAAGNFCGSTEFVVGPYDFPVEYRHLDMYKNYAGVKLRLNYGDQDFIRAYHQDMNRIWARVLDNYEYKIYHADHTTCGLGEMFDFILDTFKNPLPKPETWSHIDVYPEFKVWGYEVSSDRHYPGFTLLENVNDRGFRCSVKEFLPNGSVMPFVKVTVTTAPNYEKHHTYVINDVNLTAGSHAQYVVNSDEEGRIEIITDGALHEIGIGTTDSGPKLCMTAQKVTNINWVVPGKVVNLKVSLLNKGTGKSGNVKAVLSDENGDAEIMNAVAEYGKVDVNGLAESDRPFSFIIKSDSVEIEKFKLMIKDDLGNAWIQHFTIPVRPEVGEFKDVVVADGNYFTVAVAGDDTASVFLGNGNGDGIANPGESIVLLVGDSGLYHRTELFTNDQYINPLGLRFRESDNWGSYDHVGGSEKYSIPLISSETPDNQMVEFFATYWLPDYPYHIIKNGKIRIKVSGKDTIAPMLRKAEITGDNIVHAWVYDGGKVRWVKARLISDNGPENFLNIELNDVGIDGDRVAGDNRFGGKVPAEKFELYRLGIESSDIYGNKGYSRCPGTFLVH